MTHSQSTTTTRPRTAAAAAAAAAALAITSAATLSLAADAAIHNKATSASPVLILEYAPMNDWLTDERDAALRAALNMIPQRLRELPTELPDADDGSIEFLESAFALLQSPGRLAITFDDQNQAASFFGAGLVFSTGPTTRERVTLLQGVVSNALVQSGADVLAQPSEAFAGMSEMFTPVGPVRWGRRQAPDGWRYELHAGAVTNPDEIFTKLPHVPAFAPQDFRPVFRGAFDLAPAAPAINFFRVMAGQDPQAKQALDLAFESTGIIGDNALRWTFHSGYTPNAMVTYTITERAALHPNSITTGTTPLTHADIAMIPIDAISATATRINKDAIVGQLAALLENPEIQSAVVQFEQAAGISINNDLIAPIGDIVGAYFSDTTGGSGLASAVMYVKLKDRQRFQAATTNLNNFANAMAANALPATYVRGRTFQHNNATFNTLTFPGIPIPLELTYTITGDWLILTFNPQAAVAAAAQANNPAISILNNEKFLTYFDIARGRNVAFTFVDAERTLREGYGLATLAASALANAVRSPQSPQREPGLILPTFNEISKDIKPTLQRTYWQGDDLVKESISDPSVVASLTSSVGAASPFMTVVSSSFILSAVSQAQQRAQHSANMLREESMRRNTEPSF